ncbi:Uncharacterised protein [Metamycoplasma alkalescens]|uniref:Uncharacterized protein n=1 Tax=Metamycoplasma alkalescens TaxID=45363 RepID=A0A3B0PGL6_9BACT|nr:Uncharacterised protein [Metamycoplasma alkalescens]
MSEITYFFAFSTYNSSIVSYELSGSSLSIRLYNSNSKLDHCVCLKTVPIKSLILSFNKKNFSSFVLALEIK